MNRQQAAEKALHDQTNLLPIGQLLMVFAGLAVSLLITFVDQNGISVTLPTIAKDLHAENTISWAGTSSLIANTMFTVLYGRLSDIFGRKIVYLSALALLCIADLLCGLSQDAPMFYVFRGLAGVAGGGISSLTNIIVSDIVTLEQRGKYQGILGASLGLGNVIGPFLAAAFIMKATWRAFFWLLAPLSVCSMVVGYFLMPDNTRKASFRKNLGRIDYYGVIASSIGVIFLLIPISGGGSYFQWDSAMVISMLVIGGCSLIIFFFIEWKVATLPMLPMVIFKNKVICTLFLQSFLLGAVYQSNLYYLPLYYQNARGWSPMLSAALTTPLVVFQSLASICSGQYISRRKRYGEVIWTGFGLWTLGAGLMLLFNHHTSIGAIVVIVLIQGIGVGFTFQPTLVAFQAHCTKAHRAVIISNRNFFRCLGGACGLAVSAAILQAVLKSNLPEKYQNLAHSTYSLPSRSGVADADWEQITTAYAKASRGVFILQVPLIGICFLACFFIKDRGLERPKDPGEEEAEKKQQNDDDSRGSQEHAAREDSVPSDLESQSASTNIANQTRLRPKNTTLGSAPEQHARACDNEYPVCSNCQKAGAACDKATVRQESGQQNAYTRALEERIEYLESQLKSGRTGNNASSGVSSPVAAFLSPQNQKSIQRSSPTGIDHNAIGDLVGFLALNSLEAPAYVGSSSGVSLAANLGEMVQTTVWNQVLAPPRGLESAQSTGNGLSTSNANLGLSYQPVSTRNAGDRSRPPRMEELLAKGAEPPNDEMGSRIMNAYLTRLHTRYPFLDRRELWRLHEARWQLAKKKREELSKAEKFGIFQLYIVYAIGATFLQLSERYSYIPPERFYMTGLQQASAMCEARSIENIKAMTLLVVYHLRSASSQGVWYMIGLAMRTAIDLGLHRKANEVNLDPFTAQLRRRLFWTVYYLERVVSMSLGRPFSIADRNIDLPLPLDVNDDVRDSAILTAVPLADRPTTMTFALYLIRIRQIDSKVQHKIYRADRPLHTLRSKMDRLFLELEEWKQSALLRFSGADLDYPMLHYNRALRLLIQPFLPSLPLTDPYYHICLRAAGDICQTHKRLHQTLEYGHSFLAVQTVFMAGITLLYALWTHTSEVWSVQMSNDIRACSTVLFVMGERAAWVKKYRDAFELLVNAAMEKLEGSDAAKKVGMAELMTAQHGSANPQNTGSTSKEYPAMGPGMPDVNSVQMDQTAQDHGVRMAFQLAPWIDLEEDCPFWMPDFETLESLSGNLWGGEDPVLFDPL
ncbi:major facilitator superfamily domain-containing protein [Aspergillus pseudotamarii]|uniref:Major facilitator superfamily domain-containing protein n=1 Tax=Aspergillus pseudotamarii TaxID=132259 RepID=A0A5N6SX44_ASPPS|nr:major facilitator superfamily domain-containing protein [Aspergillus pseudotamarii]KAE8138310.1 major facilitator superfamily domain-containing protein [Aspergillus pseudotamarii]